MILPFSFFKFSSVPMLFCLCIYLFMLLIFLQAYEREQFAIGTLSQEIDALREKVTAAEQDSAGRVIVFTFVRVSS